MTRLNPQFDPRDRWPLLQPNGLQQTCFLGKRFLAAVLVVCLAGPLLPADPPQRSVLRKAAGQISRLYRDHVRLDYFLDASGLQHPVISRDDWQIRRAHVLAGLTHVTGPLPGPTRRVPLKIEYLEQKPIDNSLRHKIRYQSEPGDQVVGYLFVPRQTTTRHPAVLCLQQTNREGSVEAAGIRGAPDLAYARHLSQRGYVTLAPDYPGFGESQWDFSRPQDYGSGTMKAIWDNMRAIDLLQSLPVVDPDRIGVIGHSLGGHNAMFTAAWEPRLQVIVSNCGFTRFHKDDVPSWAGPRYMPRIATRFQNSADRIPWDFPEIIATFAPRPFLAIAPQRDSDFDYKGVQDSIAAARPIYQLHGKPDHLKAHYPDTPHAFPPAARALAYAFLDQHLKR